MWCSRRSQGTLLWGSKHTYALRWQALQIASWEVSSLGRVKNSRGVVSWGYLKATGYRTVNVPLDHMRRAFYVHRIVAFNYHGEPPSPSHVVNHIDGNRQNNSKENLEYVTQSENLCMAFARRAQIGGHQSRGRQVRVRECGKVVWQSFVSITQAAKALSISATSISKCCHGKLAACKGLEFEFVEGFDLPGEVWANARCPRTHAALPGYMVSTHGRLQGPRGVRTRGSLDSEGYRVFRQDGRNHLLHRVVVCSFRDHLPVPWEATNHKDGNKDNNHLENLEVVSHSENLRHSWGMRSSRDVVAMRRPVQGRQLGASKWITFCSATQAAQELEWDRRRIWRCCNNRRKSTGGYEWRYACQSEPLSYPGEVWSQIDAAGLVKAWKMSNKIEVFSCRRAVAAMERGVWGERIIQSKNISRGIVWGSVGKKRDGHIASPRSRNWVAIF